MRKIIKITLFLLVFIGTVSLLNYAFSSYILKIKSEQFYVAHNKLDKTWINRLKLRDSIGVSLTLDSYYFNNDFILNEKDANRKKSLLVSIPIDACWDCVQEKLEIISNAKLKIPIYIVCSPNLIRRIKIQILDEKIKGEFHFLNASTENHHEQDFYFSYYSGNNIVAFVDILLTNELLNVFINQLKNQ